MNISATQLQKLKQLLEDELGLKIKGEDLELVARAVMRFVYAKEVRKAHSNQLINKERKNGDNIKTKNDARPDEQPVDAKKSE